MNTCYHCFREGDWLDEDKCPECTELGHTSPWTVGGCDACTQEFYRATNTIKERMETRLLSSPDGFYCLDHSL